MAKIPQDHPKADWAAYRGLRAPQYTQVPDDFFDWLAPLLNEGELRVLLYLLRRTFGFKRAADAVSLEQLCGGIVRTDGTRLDFGTGLSRTSVLRAVRGLKTKQIIEAQPQSDARGTLPTVYRVRMAPDQDASNAWRAGVGGSTASGTPEGQSSTFRGTASGTPGVPRAVPTRNRSPRNSLQETARVAARINPDEVALNAKGGCMICSLAAGQHTAECPYHPANRKDTAS